MPAMRAVVGCGGGACTTGGAAGSSSGLLGKSSKLSPVTDALSKGFFTTRLLLTRDEDADSDDDDDDTSPLDRSDMFAI